MVWEGDSPSFVNVDDRGGSWLPPNEPGCEWVFFDEVLLLLLLLLLVALLLDERSFWETEGVDEADDDCFFAGRIGFEQTAVETVNQWLIVFVSFLWN